MRAAKFAIYREENVMPTYTNDLVISKSTSATNTPAVRGESKVFEGVHGISHGTHGGVVGVNDDISTDPAKPAGPGVSGSATSGVGVIGTSDTGIGMWGHSNASTGTGGVSENGIGVHGISVRGDCAAGVGVSANSVTGRAVEANSPQGTGVVGTSTSGGGVWGGSDSSSGVGGMSNSGHGVHGVSTSDHGVVGNSTSGRGVAGFSDSWQGVYGHSNSQAGVVGESDHFDGVFGISHNLTAAGVCHELVEQCVDRDGSYEEIGDPCNCQNAFTYRGWGIQKYWSEWGNRCINGDNPVSLKQFLKAIGFDFQHNGLKSLGTSTLNLDYIALTSVQKTRVAMPLRTVTIRQI
jgi:hypothetical protein